MSESLTFSCILLEALFLSLVCHVQTQCEGFCFILLYFILLFCCYLLEGCSFQTRDRKEMGSDCRENGKEFGGVEGRKTVIRIFCMRKTIFNERV